MLRALLLAGLAAAVLAPSASGYTAATIAHGAITGAGLANRLSRPGGSAVSTCATPSAYPGATGSGPYGVSAQVLLNAGNADVCVTRTLTANSAQCQTNGIEAGSFTLSGLNLTDTATWPGAFVGDPRNSAGGAGSASNTVSWATKVPAEGLIYDIFWDVSNTTHCDDYAYKLDTDRLWPFSHPDLKHADGAGLIGAGTAAWPGVLPSISYSWQRCPVGVGPCQPFGGSAKLQAIGADEVGSRIVARHSATMAGTLPNSVDSDRSAPVAPLGPVVHANTASHGGATIEPGTDRLDGSECDECAIPITPPFPLQLQGRSYATAQAGSNGIVLLGDDAMGGGYGTSCLADPGSSPMVAPFWQDLEGDGGGDEGIYTGTAGAAPHRRYIVEWRSEPYNGDAAERFEVVFHEDSPVISYIYGDNDGGGGAVIGAQTAQVAPFAVNASCETGTPTPAGTQIDLTPQGPVISGSGRVGEALTATNGDWDSLAGSPAFSGRWLRCDGEGAACVPIDGAATATYTPLASDVGARLVYEVTATDALGSQSARSAPTAAVEAQPVVTVPDTTAPSLTTFALTHKRFRVAKARTPVAARKAPRGTKLSYTLSEPAAITFTIYLDRKGRFKGKTCKVTLKKGRRCVLATKKGKLTRNAPAGASTLAFSGRVGRRALKPGRYEIRAIARDTAGNVSKPKGVSFKIVR